MRVPSISSNAVRVEPQQERSTRRLASFLDAAADLFVEVGFEAATMTAIAERSGASIGTLYHYFPDKRAVASALLNQYAEEIAAQWKPLMEQAPRLTLPQFADLFIERMTQFVREHPAHLALLSAPTRFTSNPAARRALRSMVANAFQAKNPELSNERALLSANVAVQIIKGMVALYNECPSKDRASVIAEFKKVMTLYLSTVLS